MRRLGPGEELGVVLHPEEERMVRELEDLDAAVGGATADREPVRAEPVEVRRVDLEAVAVPLPDLGPPVDRRPPVESSLREIFWEPRRIVPPRSATSFCSSRRQTTGSGVCGSTSVVFALGSARTLRANSIAAIWNP